MRITGVSANASTRRASAKRGWKVVAGIADRLQVDWRVEVGPSRLVPPFVLQPGVEKAIVHGTERRRGYDRVTIEDRGGSARPGRPGDGQRS
jgi:hypothetical protein